MTYDWIRERKSPKFNGRLAELKHEHGENVKALMIEIYNKHGNVADAAKELGVEPSTFHNWCYRLKLEIKRILVETDA